MQQFSKQIFKFQNKFHIGGVFKQINSNLRLYMEFSNQILKFLLVTPMAFLPVGDSKKGHSFDSINTFKLL